MCLSQLHPAKRLPSGPTTPELFPRFTTGRLYAPFRAWRCPPIGLWPRPLPTPSARRTSRPANYGFTEQITMTSTTPSAASMAPHASAPKARQIPYAVSFTGDRVYRQSPGAGTVVDQGSEVSLLLSFG